MHVLRLRNFLVLVLSLGSISFLVLDISLHILGMDIIALQCLQAIQSFHRQSVKRIDIINRLIPLLQAKGGSYVESTK